MTITTESIREAAMAAYDAVMAANHDAERAHDADADWLDRAQRAIEASAGWLDPERLVIDDRAEVIRIDGERDLSLTVFGTALFLLDHCVVCGVAMDDWEYHNAEPLTSLAMFGEQLRSRAWRADHGRPVCDACRRAREDAVMAEFDAAFGDGRATVSRSPLAPPSPWLWLPGELHYVNLEHAATIVVRPGYPNPTVTVTWPGLAEPSAYGDREDVEAIAAWAAAMTRQAGR